MSKGLTPGWPFDANLAQKVGFIKSKLRSDNRKTTMSALLKRYEILRQFIHCDPPQSAASFTKTRNLGSVWPLSYSDVLERLGRKSIQLILEHERATTSLHRCPDCECGKRKARK